MQRPRTEIAVTTEQAGVIERSYGRYRALVDDWPSFRDALLAPHVPCVWAHPLRPASARLVEILAASGITAEPMAWYPGGYRWRATTSHDASLARHPGRHWGYLAGLYHVQEESSLVPVALLDPRPGERVLDLCAAPGNKTAQIALALGNRGTVVANDRDASRVPAIQDVVARLGLCNVSMTGCDGAAYPAQPALFDKALVDAPCTAEGTVRKLAAPRVVADEYRQWIAGIQGALLRRAIRLTRPGGRIVYATCTFAPEENELVVDAALRACAGAVEIRPARLAGLATAPGITSWQGQTLDGSLARAIRIWPHLSDTGGFFCAVLERTTARLPDDGPGFVPGPGEPGELGVPALAHDVVAAVRERHGIAADVLAELRAVRRGKHLALVAADHALPVGVDVRALGLPAIPVKPRQPRLSTAGALALGSAATRNVVSLEDAQVRAYHAGQSIALAPGQHARCSGGGYMIAARDDGTALGIGMLRVAGDALFESQFPRAWLRG
jgi:16S rRNA C967 or C1407 C5-methylase (RsmB/RsmF family)/NOL1/NOP2/fmu family ribosome biogenesis protein